MWDKNCFPQECVIVHEERLRSRELFPQFAPVRPQHFCYILTQEIAIIKVI